MGRDIHVPPADPILAEEAKFRTQDAGLQVIAYGSYYFCDAESPPE